jgi:hypothetical protein
VVYVGWGDSAMTRPTSSSTYGQYNAYDSNYKLWCPMFDDPDTSHVKDRTSNQISGTKTGANAPTENYSIGSTGELGYYQDFDGSDDEINFANFSHGSSFTVFCPFNSDAAGFVMANTKETTTATDGFYIISPSANTAACQIRGSSSKYETEEVFGNITTDGWNTWAVKVATIAATSFKNGAAGVAINNEGTGIDSVVSNSRDMNWGWGYQYSYHSNGKMNISIFYNGSLADTTIQTMENNQRSPATFSAYGTITEYATSKISVIFSHYAKMNNNRGF